jgi:hypothetical protein
MILRRLSEHLRAQNWTAVGGERWQNAQRRRHMWVDVGFSPSTVVKCTHAGPADPPSVRCATPTVDNSTSSLANGRDRAFSHRLPAHCPALAKVTRTTMQIILKVVPILFVLVACNQTPDGDNQNLGASGPPEPEMPYLGQTPPGTRADLFAPGIVSTDAVELNSVFSPDGREFFFTRLIDGPDETGDYPGRTRSIMHHMVYENGAWSEPRPLRLFPDAPHAWAADMSVSPDGRLLYFMGPHPVDADDSRSGLNLWVSRRVDGAWSIAEPLPEPVNSRADEIYSSVVADGSLYFNSAGGVAESPSRLYRAQRLVDGGWAEPVHVGPSVDDEFWDTFVAPDESYMVVTAERPGDFGNGDLYVSFRQTDGNWGEPINLGPEVNSDATEYCPMVTPDGRYLFFSRRRTDPPDSGWPNVVEGDVYWVDIEVVHRLKPVGEGSAR